MVNETLSEKELDELAKAISRDYCAFIDERGSKCVMDHEGDVMFELPMNCTATQFVRIASRHSYNTGFRLGMFNARKQMKKALGIQ